MNDRANDEGLRRGPATPRRRTRAEERIDSLDTSASTLASEMLDLREQVARAEQEAGESRASWQRAAADLANFRRRTEQERDDYLGLANESLLRKVLAVADDLDRAMAQMPTELVRLGWTEGLWAIDRKLRQLLASEGLTPIDAEGLPFDPREHEAIAHQETDSAPDGTVLSEVQKGYRIRDRVLRPSMVIVAKNEAGGTGGPGDGHPHSNDDGREATKGREAAGGSHD